MAVHTQLSKGVNLFGLLAGVNMDPGEASDAINILPLPDQSIRKLYGTRRLNTTSAGGTNEEILAHKGFTYRGKNNDTAVNPARGGNYGNDDAGASTFSRRSSFYTGALVLTDAHAYYWDPATRALSSAISLPAGVTVDPLPVPQMFVLQENVYIIGWASHNLRYDPTDQALYKWGWDSVPALDGTKFAAAAGGDLVGGAIYKYAAAWVDLYTGEQSGLSNVVSVTTTSANKKITMAAAFISAAYAGTRHFKDAVNLTNEDVGVALYRTGPDGGAFYFFGLYYPSLVAETETDDGSVATDDSREAFTYTYADIPRYSAAAVHQKMMYGVSWEDGDGAVRVFYNDFTQTKSQLERTLALNFEQAPLTNGEFLTGVHSTDEAALVFSNRDAFQMLSSANLSTGFVQRKLLRLNWGVGAVGPKASCYYNGWMYFLSERGPYRWSPGGGLQHIGKNMLPLFLDWDSGVCKLNPVAKAKSEVFYDPDSDCIHFVFATGTSTTINQHIYWDVHPEYRDGNFYQGWWFGQPYIKAFDFTHAYGGLALDTSEPETQFDRAARCVVTDADGYLYEYDPMLHTFGLPDGHESRFVLEAAGTTTTIVTHGGLYNADDGLAGLRFELVYTNGTIASGTITSNTDTTLTVPLLPAAPAAGDVLYIGGYKCYWRSWLDHAGDPTKHKSVGHLTLGLQQSNVAESFMDVVIATADQVPIQSDSRIALTTRLNANIQKLTVMTTGRFFFWELANSRPDQPWHLTFIRPELVAHMRERL